MPVLKRLEIDEVFCEVMFAKSSGGQYLIPGGWYPLLGLPGALNVEEQTVLFCKLQAAIEGEVQKRCLNGVVEKMRIHQSARVNGPDTMLVFASDLLHEFAVCQVPKLSDVEALAGILSPLRGPGLRLNTPLQDSRIFQTGTSRGNGGHGHDQR